jgi:hypothetical protein
MTCSLLAPSRIRRISLGACLLAALLLPACAGDPCPTSIEAFCSRADACPKNWAAAQDARTWACGGTVTLSTCGDLHVATFSGVDTGTKFYFDNNGELYRVEDYSVNFGGSQMCAAGSGDAVECNDPHARQLALCPP